MQIFVINLDQKPGRWQRMAGLLAGLPFHRIAAVDGKAIDGPEQSSRPFPGILSRYHQACILSHRAALQALLAGADRYGCVLEDDVFISPDFPKFIRDETWIPPGCDLVKIETTTRPVWFTGRHIACRNRRAIRLHSLHLGAAGYIVSRRGAEILLEMTVGPDRAIDRILFGKAGRERLHPVYQLMPALCIQGNHRGDGMTFPDMESSIDHTAPLPVAPKPAPLRKPLPAKVKRELLRPFQQLQAATKTAGLRLKSLRREGVPFV
ncbi:MAG: glycosyltransferase family 25 protein [Verrucomicrobiae bacterium]|nr:glycosyltransferase family 25 protein [Verrucomicrobiae bacterium]